MKQEKIQCVLKAVLRWLFCWIPLAFLIGVMSLLLLYVFGFYYDSDVSGFYDSDVVPFTLPAVPLMVLVVNILFRLWEYAFDKSVRFAAILSCTIPFVLFLSLLFLSVLFGW